MLILLSCLATSPVHAEPPPSPTYEDALPAGHDKPLHTGAAESIGGGETTLVQMLDVDLSTGHAALKVVHFQTANEELGFAPPDCRYAGMEDNPHAGVVLALYDLNAGTMEPFVVYKQAEEKGECTPRAQSDKTLAAAKAAFKAAGLDIAKKPHPVFPNEGVYAFPVGEGKTAVHHWKHVTDVEQDDWARLFPDDPDADFSMGATLTGLRMGDQVLLSTANAYSRNMAGLSMEDFPMAWQEGDKAVFAKRTLHRNMRSGGWESWSLTPVISLTGSPPAKAPPAGR
jgi:hypothetical protein